MHNRHRFNPAIPETDLDRAVSGLLDTIGSDSPPEVIFGDDSCPPGAVIIPGLDCCWNFDCGAIKAIERLSQGRSNVWKVAWTCNETNLPRRNQPIGIQLPSRRSVEDSQGPWRVDDPDGGLFVFPAGMDITIGRGKSATRISAGTMLGRQMFYPRGMKSFVPGNRSYAVVRAFSGYALVSDCIAQAVARGLRAPSYLVADVPERRLITLMERFGFRTIGTFGAMTSVIAPVETVLRIVRDHHVRVARLDERVKREAGRD